MTTETETSIRAERDEIERLIAMLTPLSGGIWLATDLTTHIHWTIMAASITPVASVTEGRICRAFGLVTVCAPDDEPVFLINERDTLEWIEPGQILAVRELGQESYEIRIERLDDLDARLVAAFNIQPQVTTERSPRCIAVGNGHVLQIYDEQLPTGNSAADATLRMIETTIGARQRLIGPTAGTLDVMEQMARDLDLTLRSYAVRSYVWAAVLQEQIAGMRQSLAA